jgi:hypothetical protein
MLFSSGVPKERSLLFGVEFGGGESKNLLLSFVSFTTDFGSRTLNQMTAFSNATGDQHLKIVSKQDARSPRFMTRDSSNSTSATKECIGSSTDSNLP